MGRDTGKQENTEYNKDMADIQRKTFDATQKVTGEYNVAREKLAAGNDIGANPFVKPEYLRNQNLVTSAATSAQNKGTQALLDSEANRTGVNTAARRATALDLGRTAMRTNAATRAAQANDDYLNNLDWQKMLLGSILAPAGVDTQMFGSATSGRNSATDNLAQLGVASQNMWGNIVSGALGAGGQVLGSFAGKKK